MAHLEMTSRKSLTNEQLAHWIGGKVPTRNRNLADDYENARENVHNDPKAFAALLPSYMTLVEKFVR